MRTVLGLVLIIAGLFMGGLTLTNIVMQGIEEVPVVVLQEGSALVIPTYLLIGIAGVVPGKFANKETAMMAIARIIAARLYLKVHLRYIFLPLPNETPDGN